MEMMEAIKEYVAWGPYREALKLPERVTEQYEPLAQGEYNRNFQFVHPVTGKRLVLRVNCGSQIHLENQIQYEYDTLKLLEGSGPDAPAVLCGRQHEKDGSRHSGDGISSGA